MRNLANSKSKKKRRRFLMKFDVNNIKFPYKVIDTKFRNYIVKNFTFKDDLICIIENNPWNKTLGDTIKICISAEREFWKTVVNKRQCWIAQYGIWKDIIVEAQKFINISEQDLPCNKGFCPYTRDAELRYTDKDPGAPCPIQSKLASTPIDKKYMDMVKI